MLTQLQLEGPELEPLLVRVRSELGSAARIVQAEKVRSGGVAGFFARERYELTVEVDDEPARPAASVPAPRAVARELSMLPAVTPGAARTAVVQEPTGVLSPQHEHVAEPAGAAQPVPPGHVLVERSAAEHVLSELASRVASSAATPSAAATAPSLRPSEAPVASFAAVTGLGGPADRPTEAYSAIASLSTSTSHSAHDDVVATLAAVAQSSASSCSPADPAAQAAARRAPAPVPSAFAQDGFSTDPAFPALAEHVPATRPAPPLPAAAAPLSLLDLADQVSDEEHAAVVSTESPSFASLLSQLGSRLGTETPGTTVPGTTAPVTTAPATTAPVTTAPVTTAPGTTAAATTAPATTVPATAVAPTAVLAVRADSHVSLAPAAATAAAPSIVPQQRTAVDARTSPGATSAAPGDEDAGSESTGAELARLGLPRHLRPQASGDRLHTALRAALTRLPSAPPATNRAGGVLAVVGPVALALRVAREIAEELGLPVTTSVAVATIGEAALDVSARQVLRAPAEAADRRAAWRRRGNLTVVAVDAPLTSTGAADAREFLSALAPSATWGVVEATRKAQDIGAWTRALGGVHALALTDVEETADPAAVLELGIPVTRLGARPATPRAWATLLTGRLAA